MRRISFSVDMSNDLEVSVDLMKEVWSVAIETLSWMAMRGLNEHLAFVKTVNQLGIKDSPTLRLSSRLVFETVRRQNLIESSINHALRDRSLDEFNLGVQAFLKLYVYETRMARKDTRFDIKQAEAIAGIGRSILGWKELKEVEPILGRLLTQKIDRLFAGLNDEESISLRTFHPAWFVKYCIKLFGRTETLNLLEADVQKARTYVRLNTLNGAEDEILEKLGKEGLHLERTGLACTYAVQSSKIPLMSMHSYSEGLVIAQDMASCFASLVANPFPGQTVLDVCAAPGAKTTFLSQQMKNQGVIYSIDYSKRRMQSWKNEVHRMGAINATPIIADSQAILPIDIKADLVVLDPPCTSSGVFRKMPSSKWRLSPESIDRMAQIQWRMLDNCFSYVKKDSALVYSTCSLTVEENEMLIERFLKWYPEFALTEIKPELGLPGLRGLEKCRRLYPHIHNCNGFFIAKLTKTAG